jgi:hypothetical protein
MGGCTSSCMSKQSQCSTPFGTCGLGDCKAKCSGTGKEAAALEQAIEAAVKRALHEHVTPHIEKHIDAHLAGRFQMASYESSEAKMNISVSPIIEDVAAAGIEVGS